MNEQLEKLDNWVKQLEQATPTEALELYGQIVAESKALFAQLNTLNDTVKHLTHEAEQIIHDTTH